VVNYFKDVSLTGGKSLTLAPGTYVIASTKNNSPALNVSGGSTLTGLGVTIFLAGTVPTVNIQSNANVNLVAPTAAQAASTGGTKGLLFYSNSSGSSSFMGGGSMTLQGAIDLPNQDITFGGNTSTAAAQQCTVIVSKTMTFSGATNIGSSGCSALGTQTVANPGTLIE
jgi:hypothetical protein